MGAWSHEPFGNDIANDWAYGLKEISDLSLIEAALDRVLVGEESPEAPDASEAVAATEVLAKLLGKGTQSDAHTIKVDAWVKVVTARPDAALLRKASNALERIRAENSELRMLWGARGAEEWHASISALQSAVSA